MFSQSSQPFGNQNRTQNEIRFAGQNQDNNKGKPLLLSTRARAHMRTIVVRTSSKICATISQANRPFSANLVLNQYWQLRLWGTTAYSRNGHFAKRMAYGPVENSWKTAVFRILRLLYQNPIRQFSLVSSQFERKMNFVRSLMRYVIVLHRQSFRWFAYDNHPCT